MLPLLHASLAGADRARVPAAVLDRLRVDARANVHHALFLTAQLLKLLARFERAGARAVPFKGPVLAAMAYGDVTLRQFSDLDIFVHKSDLATLARLMIEEGYLSDTQDGGEETERTVASDGDVAYLGPSHYPFYRRDGRCRVDLQWRMADQYFSFSLDGEGAAWDFVDVSLAGRRVRTFAATDTLLILCVHGAKHQFEMLKWVCDVAECLHAQRDTIDWEALQRKSSALHAGRMVGLGLGLAHELLGAPLPPEVSRRIRADRTLAALVGERRATLFDGTVGSVSSAQRLVFYLRAKDTWQDQARFCVTYARQFVERLVKPTVHDISWVELPTHLSPLYFVLRPIRLLMVYARRTERPDGRDAHAPGTVPSPSKTRPVASVPPKSREGARP